MTWMLYTERYTWIHHMYNDKFFAAMNQLGRMGSGISLEQANPKEWSNRGVARRSNRAQFRRPNSCLIFVLRAADGALGYSFGAGEQVEAAAKPSRGANVRVYAPVFDRTIAGMTHAPNAKATGMTCVSNAKNNAIYHVDNSIHLRPPAVVLI